MLITSIDEATIASLVTLDDARDAMREMFSDMAIGDIQNYPVVRESVEPTGAIFGIKSGFYCSRKLLGLKAGGYFPLNAVRGDANHQSYVMLFDPETGKPRAIVEGNLLTRLRTAAAASISIELLARKDAGQLGVIGAGTQAVSHIEAALRARNFTKVVIWNRDQSRGERLAKSLSTRVDPEVAVAGSLESLVRESDVIITLTAAIEPLVKVDWARPGSHFVCMGADTVGKQEVEAALICLSRVFTDSPAQSITIGECQSAWRAGMITQEHIVGTLGDILQQPGIGRLSDNEVTLFDGTGVAAQDLIMADLVFSRYTERSDVAPNT